MLKTNRSVAKRFKFTGRGKIKRTRAYKGHLLGHKSKTRKRNLRHAALVDSRDMKQVRRLLPYG
ncbi:MAG: 50S ribosomal protein L35 [Candidatus Omnitrophica bacterium]|nr:50S ribosomal protein L35 [Candidatus Omnitrophota bacterium]MDD5351596.1 50S ribosomal protein L35 [Candidatus Omnitrophota bacterium]